MTATSSRYRVVCRCGHEATVGPGQAGGSVTCERCGDAIAVPRLRDLQASVVIESAPARRWHAAQGWALGGLSVAFLAGLAAWLLPPQLAPPPALPDEAVIRAAIESTDAATAYKAWQAMRSSGVDRGTLPGEMRIRRAAGAAGRIATVLWTVAAAGAIAAAAAGVGWLLGERRATGPRSAGAGR